MAHKDSNTLPNSDDFFQDETPITEPGSESVKSNLNLLKEAEIDPAEIIAAPPTCLQIKSEDGWIPIATLGNISLIIGKAKSRKTFYITLALSAAIGNETILSKFEGILPDLQSMVLFFDTEQSRFHAQRTVRRVCQLARIAQPINFKAYGLRKFSPSERLSLIEAAIESMPELGLVVIDGIRDLVTSINDEAQATTVCSKLLKWTEELNIHIIVVLHQNKSDANPRGHLGTELLNKAETTITITRDDKNKAISIVDGEACRDKEPDPFAFDIDEQGLPRLVEGWSAKSADSRGSHAITPTGIPSETHKEVLRRVFRSSPNLLYRELQSSIKLVMEKDFSTKIGDNKVRDFIHYYSSEGWLVQNQTSNARERYYYIGVLLG